MHRRPKPQITGASLTAWDQTLLDELRRRGQMTTPDAAEFLGESDRLAVRALLRAGEIDAVGERRWRRWAARSE